MDWWQIILAVIGAAVVVYGICYVLAWSFIIWWLCSLFDQVKPRK